MISITTDNLSSFLEYYHYFHDSYITNINYDAQNSQIELLIDVFWSGEPKLKEDGTYETNRVKMKMNLNGVEQYISKDTYLCNYIDEVYIKYIKIKNKEFICFESNEENPFIYVICDNIEYEEEKN